MFFKESDNEFKSLPDPFLFPHLITNWWWCIYEYLKIVLLILWMDKLFRVKINKALQDDYKIYSNTLYWSLLRPGIVNV